MVRAKPVSYTHLRRDKTKHAAYKVDIAGTIAFIVALPPLLIMISMGGSSIAWVSVESLILICVSAKMCIRDSYNRFGV